MKKISLVKRCKSNPGTKIGQQKVLCPITPKETQTTKLLMEMYNLANANVKKNQITQSSSRLLYPRAISLPRDLQASKVPNFFNPQQKNKVLSPKAQMFLQTYQSLKASGKAKSEKDIFNIQLSSNSNSQNGKKPKKSIGSKQSSQKKLKLEIENMPLQRQTQAKKQEQEVIKIPKVYENQIFQYKQDKKGNILDISLFDDKSIQEADIILKANTAKEKVFCKKDFEIHQNNKDYQDYPIKKVQECFINGLRNKKIKRLNVTPEHPDLEAFIFELDARKLVKLLKKNLQTRIEKKPDQQYAMVKEKSLRELLKKKISKAEIPLKQFIQNIITKKKSYKKLDLQQIAKEKDQPSASDQKSSKI